MSSRRENGSSRVQNVIDAISSAARMKSVEKVSPATVARHVQRGQHALEQRVAAEALRVDRAELGELERLEQDLLERPDLPALGPGRRDGEQHRLRRPRAGRVVVERDAGRHLARRDELDPLVEHEPGERLRRVERLRQVRDERELAGRQLGRPAVRRRQRDPALAVDGRELRDLERERRVAPERGRVRERAREARRAGADAAHALEPRERLERLAAEELVRAAERGAELGRVLRADERQRLEAAPEDGFEPRLLVLHALVGRHRLRVEAGRERVDLRRGGGSPRPRSSAPARRASSSSPRAERRDRLGDAEEDEVDERVAQRVGAARRDPLRRARRAPPSASRPRGRPACRARRRRPRTRSRRRPRGSRARRACARSARPGGTRRSARGTRRGSGRRRRSRRRARGRTARARSADRRRRCRRSDVLEQPLEVGRQVGRGRRRRGRTRRGSTAPSTSSRTSLRREHLAGVVEELGARCGRSSGRRPSARARRRASAPPPAAPRARPPPAPAPAR